MLQTIRERMSGPIVWVIIGIISIPFAFVGIETFNQGGADPTVAEAGGQKITASQLDNAYQQRMQRLQQMLGENFRSDMIEPESFKAGVLQEMIQETIFQQHARKVGYTASDAAVLDAIKVIPAFQDNGQFSAEAYRAALERQGMKPAGFESQVREGLGIDQIRDGVLSSGFVTPAEAAAAWRLARQERVFASVSFKAADFESTVTVSDSDIAQHFEQNQGRYQAPERIKLQVVELDLARLPEGAAPDPAALKALYDADSGVYTTAEERRASHILFSIGADKAAALKKAEEAKAKLDAGTASFAELARTLSDDPGSKEQGGDLGWVRKGLMTPKFEEALFALAPGTVSAPVETEFGWHLIRLDEVKASTTRAFEDATVQAELLAKWKKADTEKRFQELSEKMEQLAFEKSGSLAEVAAAVGATVETTDWFTRTSGAGITANPALVQAAFSEEVLRDGENSKPLSIGPNRIAVVRKAEYEAARARTLDEVRAVIRGELLAARATEKAKAEAAALEKALAAGGSLTALASEGQRTVFEPGAVSREAATVPRKLLDAAFRLPRPAAGKVSVGQADLGNGEVAVIVLSEVRDATPETGDAAFRQQSTQLRDALAGAEFTSFRVDLEKRLGVERKDAVATPAEPAAATTP